LAHRKYELLAILDPSRSEEQNTETLTKIDEVVTKYGGTPDRHQVLGKRRLAYSIAGRRDGYYVAIYFDCDTVGPVLAEVDRHCRYDESVLRHMTTLAVVGKSKGDPSKAPEERPRFGYGGPRSGAPRYGSDRGPRPAPPVEGAVATAVAPVEGAVATAVAPVEAAGPETAAPEATPQA